MPPHYAASKHGLLGLVRSLAAEFAKNKLVTVNAVCPGYVDTPMTDQSVARVTQITGRSEERGARSDHQHERQRTAGRPRRDRDDDPDPVPAASRDINGAAITIDGGNQRVSLDPASFTPEHFRWDFADGVATVTLDRPEHKNPLTFDSYAELRDTFRALDVSPGR